MKKVWAFLCIMFSFFTLSACEELEGFDFGDLDQWLEDLQNGGLLGQDSNDNQEDGLFTIYFDLMGAGSLDVVYLHDVDKIPEILPEPLPFEGHTFVGWYTDTSFVEQAIPGGPITKDTTLYAYYNIDIYNVKFVYNGEILLEYDVPYGTNLYETPSIAVEEGYVFKGWGVNGNLFKGYVKENLVLEPIIECIEVISIEEFKKRADETTNYFIQGIVTACNYKRGENTSGTTSYILSDETGNIFVYAHAEVYLGDEVLISALYKSYYGTPEVVSCDYLKIVSEGNDYSVYCKDVYEYNIENIQPEHDGTYTQEQLLEKYYGKFLKINGLLIKKGSNYVLVPGINSEFSIRLFGNSNYYAEYENKYVSVYGFAREVRVNYMCMQTQYLEINDGMSAETIEQVVEKIRDEVQIDSCEYDTIYQLPQTTYYLNEAVLEYKIVSESKSATLNGYELIIKNSVLSSPEEVVIEVKVNYLNNVYYQSFTCYVNPITFTSVADFLAMKDVNNYYILKGYITNTTSNTGHMFADDSGVIFAYVNAKVAVGDEVIISAKYQNYYGAPEIGVGSKLLEVISTNNDISKYIPEAIEQDVDQWKLELEKEDFNADEFGEALAGKLLHFKGYYYSRTMILTSDNEKNIVYLYLGSLNPEVEVGQLVEVYGYFRAVKSINGVNIQVENLIPVQSDAKKTDLEQFYKVPEEFVGQKIMFEGIITEKVDEGLFVATQIIGRKEYNIYVEGNFEIGDRYSFIGHVELFDNDHYLVTRRYIDNDRFTADVLRKLETNQCIILDSSIEYKPHYGTSLFSDGLITNCTYEDNVLTFYLETHPYDDPSKTVVFVLSVQVELENIDTQMFVGKKVTGKLYKETYNEINTHFVLDLSLILIS